jgi:LysM repeat protein
MARKGARYLAPLALIAVIVATFLVVQSGIDTKRDTTTIATTTVLSVVRHRPSHQRFYVVRAGDTLSTIAVKTGISVSTLEALNPHTDPNALQTGQRLRLHR